MKNLKLTPVLLPTEGASELFIDTRDYQLHSGQNILTPSEIWVNQHLYLISNRETKRGKWCYDISDKSIKKAEFNYGTSEDQQYFKIEFTTHPKLIVEGVLGIDGNTKAFVKFKSEIYKDDFVPIKNIQVAFLCEFCNRYNNKAKVIKDNLPSFLYEDDGEIKTGRRSDAIVTDEWNKWKSAQSITSSQESPELYCETEHIEAMGYVKAQFIPKLINGQPILHIQ